MPLLFFFAVSMPACADGWHDDLPQAKRVGGGDFSWFGLSIYSAALWSEHLPFSADAPFALELTYHRKISRERFVKTSIDEIQRLSGGNLSADKSARWENELSHAFVDVSPGDKLIGVFLPSIGCRFYNQKERIADITDIELAKAFFSIWLDARSKDEQLRKQLLGTSQ